MIDFSLTDEQRAIQELARDFARREIEAARALPDMGGTNEIQRLVIARALMGQCMQILGSRGERGLQ